MLTRTLATLALALFAVASPVPAGSDNKIVDLQPKDLSPRDELIVFNPKILSPTRGLKWTMGQKYNVTWATNNFPPKEKDNTGLILLGHGGNNSENLNIKAPLANHFRLRTGRVEITIPLGLQERDNYFIVLFGDSGNASPPFSIVPPAESTSSS